LVEQEKMNGENEDSPPYFPILLSALVQKGEGLLFSLY
jgi:hypothetical protein